MLKRGGRQLAFLKLFCVTPLRVRPRVDVSASLACNNFRLAPLAAIRAISESLGPVPPERPPDPPPSPFLTCGAH